MKKEKIFNILLSLIGIAAILAAIVAWFFVGTVGLFMATYSYELNKEAHPSLTLVMGGIIGGVILIIGIGMLKRKQWSRKALIVLWFLTSGFIIGFFILNLKHVIADFENFAFWIPIAVVGILFIIFLTRPEVKGMFR